MFSTTRKKFRLFRSWTSGHPVWCAWQVTYRCNFRCQFCSYWKDAMGKQAEPDVAEYARGARKLASYGTLLVSLAGGEPTLRKDLPDIVSVIGEYHFPFMTTNGWLVTRQLARDIMQAGAWGVSVSIDYADAKRHDSARGKKDAWKRAWRAVELLSQERKHPWQRVNVIAVLMKDNLDDLERILQMASERESYFMIQPYGHLKTGSTEPAHSGEPVAGRLLDLHNRYPNFLSNKYFLERFDQFLSGEGIPSCMAGRAFFNIDSTGDTAICVENRHKPVANLFRDSGSVIHQRLKKASAKNKCTACWYNCRGEIECFYNPSLIHSLPTYFFDRGAASGKMGRW